MPDAAAFTPLADAMAFARIGMPDGGHVYRIDGRDVPGVTTVLRHCGMVDYDGVPPLVLEKAAERGRAVDVMTELYDRHGVEDDDPELGGYLKGWIAFREATGFVPERIQAAVFHSTYRFAGQLDRAGVMNGGRALVDIKAVVEVKPATAIQLAAYEMCLPERHRRMAVQLKPDGTYRVHEYRDPQDARTFLAALAVVHWRMKHGGIR